MKAQCIIFTALFLLLAAPAHAAELHMHVGKDRADVTTASHTAKATLTTASATPQAHVVTSTDATDTSTTGSGTQTSAATSALATSTGSASSTAIAAAQGTTAGGTGTKVTVGSATNIYALSHAFSPTMTLALLGAALVLAVIGFALTQAHAAAPHLKRVWG